MGLTRMTLFFQQTTAPTGTAAVPRTGGWSESLWTSLIPFNPFTTGQWLRYRSMLLPPQASIVGARAQDYTINGNKLIPGGSVIYRGVVVGSNGHDCDVPQIGLQIGGSVVGAPNAARMVLRGIPDGMVVNGEFAPSANYTILVSQYLAFLPAAVPFGMVGRDLNQAVYRVTAINGTQLTTSAVVGGVVNGQTMIRFVRCVLNNGAPVLGTYLVTAGAGTNTLTLAGLSGTLTRPNGLCRVDAIAYYPFQQLTAARVIVRKVGRPFVQYRGRASKRAQA